MRKAGILFGMYLIYVGFMLVNRPLNVWAHLGWYWKGTGDGGMRPEASPAKRCRRHQAENLGPTSRVVYYRVKLR